MLRSAIYPALAWCSLGYVFLGQGQPTGAILASMAAITTAWLAHHVGPSAIGDAS